MTKYITAFAAFLAGLVWLSAEAETETPAPQSLVSDVEVRQLLFMREEEKLARDVYLTLADTWNARVFSNIARSEQKHMDTLAVLVQRYGLTDPVTSNDIGAFTDPTLDALYGDLVVQGAASYLEALYVGALIEEIDILDLEEAIEYSTLADVTLAYESLMAGSENHLRAFTGQIENSGIEYLAQVLEPERLNAILGRSTPEPFRINPGLNDTWYQPETAGQGFSISVYPDLELIFLAWFTFDATPPGAETSATVGDPGQRWLTAFGPYSGTQAELEIEVTGGGLFDQADPAAHSVPGGTILLTFEDCSSGLVRYSLSASGLEGEIPIQRLAPDNAGLCEAYLVKED